MTRVVLEKTDQGVIRLGVDLAHLEDAEVLLLKGLAYVQRKLVVKELLDAQANGIVRAVSMPKLPS